MNAMLPSGSLRYRSVFERDGLTIELEGGGYNKVGGPAFRVPHDLAHFVVEDALGLDAGLWGVLAAGGMFAHCTVLAGRRPPHAARRAQAVVDGAGGRLAQAEQLVRQVADLALADTFRRPLPGFDADAVEAACRSLRAMSLAWRQLAVGDSLRVVWRLPAPRPVKR